MTHPDTAAPVRVQLSRAKGWKMPENTVKVDRSTKWGNPCIVGGDIDQAYARHAFYNWLNDCQIQLELHGKPPSKDAIRDALRGKNLACWCKPGTACHADILLKIANEAQP